MLLLLDMACDRERLISFLQRGELKKLDACANCSSSLTV